MGLTLAENSQRKAGQAVRRSFLGANDNSSDAKLRTEVLLLISWAKRWSELDSPHAVPASGLTDRPALGDAAVEIAHLVHKRIELEKALPCQGDHDCCRFLHEMMKLIPPTDGEITAKQGNEFSLRINKLLNYSERGPHVSEREFARKVTELH